MEDKVYELIFNEEDPSWESLIYQLVRDGKINPWDIDISVLSQEYLKMMDNLKNFNFRVSGKVILAAAILLKLKTRGLGLEEFVSLTEEPEEEVYSIAFPEPMPDDMDGSIIGADNLDKAVDLKVPRARKRKVTITELTEALKRAMEVEDRREERRKEDLKILEEKKRKMSNNRKKKIDIFKKIKEVYNRIILFVKDKKGNTAEFVDILPSQEKRDVIWTFVPLLHLAHSGKIRIEQKEAFGPIFVSLKNGRSKEQN
ncbi:MAG: segregation/condensation protein A [Candidatus Woesearchaeota archaeon]|nr:MAG: segregation/condensation protein A [Candidatus Woesearchaeota archaeon]